MKRWVMNIFWSFPFLSNVYKEKIYYLLRRIILREKHDYEIKKDILREYSEQIFLIPYMKNSSDYIFFNEEYFNKGEKDPFLIAYYLPQFHPFKENDEWWGKGTTEWNNVSRAVPQFLGHYQPRLPGEMGYYDLRLKENIARQIELAKQYGIQAFCYYYYWFDGKRLLDKPLDLFLKLKEMDFHFCLCWANEDWTRRFDGTSGEIIMQQGKTVESYKNFIKSIGKYICDKRYLEIKKAKVLIVYKPYSIPECEAVLNFWRMYCRKNGYGELYLIAIKDVDDKRNYLKDGFDAISEFQPHGLDRDCDNLIKTDLNMVRKKFYGHIYDYKYIVENKKYFFHKEYKLYRSVIPMWDNTPRRDNQATVFHGSTPALYENWLLNVILETRNRKDLDASIIFINAWNEWGEGAYLEPDRKYGYAYLQATRNAIEKSRLY